MELEKLLLSIYVLENISGQTEDYFLQNSNYPRFRLEPIMNHLKENECFGCQTVELTDEGKKELTFLHYLLRNMKPIDGLKND